MEIPDLIKQRLGNEALESAVNLGDEDLVCFTPTRTLIYHGEGLLSDDSIEVYEHDIERLDVSEGRRKAAFTLTYVDREERFTVARDRADPVLERLLEGVLTVTDVIDEGESVEGAFRFSELTLIITDKRVVKHIGTYLWDADFEEYPYADMTGLDFEEGSVATQIVISVDGRPQRIKAPSKDARLVRRTLTEALFEFYDVDSLAELNDLIGDDEDEDGDDELGSSDIELDESITPLVSSDEEVETVDPTADARSEDDTGDFGITTDTSSDDESGAGEPVEERGPDRHGEPAVDPEEIQTMKSRLTTLTKVVKRQNKLLKQQHETIDELVEELKRQQ